MKTFRRMAVISAVLGGIAIGGIATAGSAGADPLGSGSYVGQTTYSDISGTNRVGKFRWNGSSWDLISCTRYTTTDASTS